MQDTENIGGKGTKEDLFAETATAVTGQSFRSLGCA